MSKIEEQMKKRAELRNISDARDVRIFPDAITAAKRLLLMPDKHQIKFQVWDIVDGVELHLFDGGSQELIDFVDKQSQEEYIKLIESLGLITL